MCVGINRKHFECGHIKDFKVISECPFGVTSVGACRHNIQEVVYTSDILTPSLCRPCYILQEEFIYGMYQGEIDVLRQQIESVHKLMRTVPDMEERMLRALEIDLARYEDTLQEAISDRRGMLAKFRRSQGVWGDG